MAADVEDSARKGKGKVTTKKQGGSGKSRGTGGRSLDSCRFKAQRRAELETPSEATYHQPAYPINLLLIMPASLSILLY
jgi:hypothetical protein